MCALDRRWPAGPLLRLAWPAIALLHSQPCGSSPSLARQRRPTGHICAPPPGRRGRHGAPGSARQRRLPFAPKPLTAARRDGLWLRRLRILAGVHEHLPRRHEPANIVHWRHERVMQAQPVCGTRGARGWMVWWTVEVGGEGRFFWGGGGECTREEGVTGRACRELEQAHLPKHPPSHPCPASRHVVGCGTTVGPSGWGRPAQQRPMRSWRDKQNAAPIARPSAHPGSWRAGVAGRRNPAPEPSSGRRRPR